MARTWLSVRVELVSGRGDDFWPWPGRVFAVARSHTFGELAEAIDVFGVVPPQPVPYFGWGALPDQYGRQWDGDDGGSPVPKPPKNPVAKLPPILPWWGPRRRHD